MEAGSGRTMRAFALQEFGTPPSVLELPALSPSPGQLLVRIHAASVNPFDVAVAAGMLKDMMEHRLPVVIGRDFAGVVEEVGEGVTEYEAGDEVVGLIPPAPYLQEGTFADYVISTPGPFLARKPSNLDFDHAAALGLAATTAEVCLRAISPQPGQRVLIVGAGGGVGGYATQLVAASGATTIATCRPADAERVQGLGAAETIDYNRGVASQLQERFPDGVDSVIDVANRDPAAFQAIAEKVRPGGRVATTNRAANPDELAGRGISATNVNGQSDPSAFAHVLAAASEGRLTSQVAQVFSLDHAAEALNAAAAGGTGGKVIVRVA